MSAEMLSSTKGVDPRVVRTRRMLCQALTDLLGERGFRSLTVREIAQRAGVNRVTFYAHFPDKYALLEDTVRELFQQHLARRVGVAAGLSPETLERLIVAVCEFLEMMDRRCPPPHGQFEPLMEKQVKAVLSDLLLRWLPGDGSEGSPGPDRVAAVASWAIYGAAMQWKEDAGSRPEAFARQVLPIIWPSLEVAAARARADG